MVKMFTSIDEKVFISMDLTALSAGEIHLAYHLKEGIKTDDLEEKIGSETIQLYYCYYRSLLKFESALIKSEKMPGFKKLFEACSALVKAGEFFNTGELEIRARFYMFLERELAFPADVYATIEQYKHLFDDSMKLDGTMKRGLKRYFALDFMLYWLVVDLYAKHKKPCIPLVLAFLDEQQIEAGNEQAIRQRVTRLRKERHWGHPRDVIRSFQLDADGTLKKRTFDS